MAGDLQVQQGCQSHCQGTSQSRPRPGRRDIQSATAIAGGTGSPSNATALNQSTTGQFIWQVQSAAWPSVTERARARRLHSRLRPPERLGALRRRQRPGSQRRFCDAAGLAGPYGCQSSATQLAEPSSTQSQSTTSRPCHGESWSPTPPTAVAAAGMAGSPRENLGITIQTSWQYQAPAASRTRRRQPGPGGLAGRPYLAGGARGRGIPPREPEAPPAETPPAETPAPTRHRRPRFVGLDFRPDLDRARDRHLAPRLGRRRERILSPRALQVTSSSGPGAGATTETRVQSSTRIEQGSATTKTRTSTSSSTSTSVTSSDSSSTDGQPLSSLADSGSSDGGTAWLLISLLIGSLMVLGAAFLRKLRTARVVG